MSTDNSDINKKIEFERLEENRVIAQEHLASPHAIIACTEKSLRSAKPNDRGLHIPKARDCLNRQVGLDSIDRALRIMDTLVKSLES